MQRLDDLLSNRTIKNAELEKEVKQWRGEHDMVRRDHASIIVDNEELRATLKDAEDWNNWYQDQLNSAWLEEGVEEDDWLKGDGDL